MGRTQRKRKKTFERPTIVDNDLPIINLKKHLKLKRNLLPCLKICDFKATGRGFICNRPIDCNTVLLQIPLDSMITFNALICSGIQTIFLPESKFNFQELLSVFLILERHKINSEWKFYFDTIPKQPPLLPCFAYNHEIECLPKDLKELVQNSKEKFNQAWHRVNKFINSQSICPCCNESVKSIVNFVDFSWGYAIVNTRAVYVDPTIFGKKKFDLILDEPSMALCPLLDMFNHSCEAKTHAELIKLNNEWFYQLSTLTNHERYQQVFISYGCHNNDLLMNEYGFFIPGNSLDCVKFTLKEILDVMKTNLSSIQKKFLLHKNITDNLYIGFQGLSFNIKALLYILLQKNTMKWSTHIFSANYESEIEIKMKSLAKTLLKEKSREYFLMCNEDTNKQFSNEFQVVMNYLEYRRTLCDNLQNFYKKNVAVVIHYY